jgi:hypothetical protein
LKSCGAAGRCRLRSATGPWLKVDLLPGADPISTRRSIEAAIGPGDLHAQTVAERFAQFRVISRVMGSTV